MISYLYWRNISIIREHTDWMKKKKHVMGLIHTNLFVFLRKETRDFKQRVLFVRQIVNKEKQVEVLEQKIGF